MIVTSTNDIKGYKPFGQDTDRLQELNTNNN